MKRVLLILLTLTLFNCSEDDTSPEENLGSGILTDQEGNDYPYITYGDQIWTVKNTETTTYRDGTPIPQVTDRTDWLNLTTLTSLTKGAWCYFDNDPTKGKLYNWYAVMGIYDEASLNDPSLRKEFAPEGWHVPSEEEWKKLENYLIANGYNYDGTTTENKIAKSIASTTGWDTNVELNVRPGTPSYDQNSNNSSGFNVFPEGIRGYTGSFHYNEPKASFWSSTKSLSNSYFAWTARLWAYQSYLQISEHASKGAGYSVRFVKD